MAPNRVSIKDVSERAGVSIATVSNVLNNRKGHVSKETADRVHRAVDELGYRPSKARNRPRATNDLLGVVSRHINEPSIRIFSGINQTATNLGFDVLHCNHSGDPADEVRYVKRLIERSVDGIVFIAGPSDPELAPLRLAAEAGIPFVIANSLVDSERFLQVLPDHVQGANDLVKSLIHVGHEKIGFIHFPVEGPRATLAGIERMVGFRKAIEEHNLITRDEWIVEGVHGALGAIEIGHSAMSTMLSSRQLPTAVVCGNDYMALGAIKAVQQKGLSAPKDLAVVGFGDIELASHWMPPLTSLRMPWEAVGSYAVEALTQNIWRGTPLVGLKRIPCKVVLRGSSAPRALQLAQGVI